MITIEKSNAVIKADWDATLVYKSGSRYKIKHLCKGDSFTCPEKEAFLFAKAEEKLSEGQHDSPPKGYPTSRSEYAVPEYYMFPIDDAKHVRAAMAYFSKHSWRPDEHKKEAAKRILRAAKKHGIEVSKDNDVYRAAHG